MSQPTTEAGPIETFRRWIGETGIGGEAALFERALQEAAAIDVERLALYMHQARTSNDEPIYDMDEARRRAREVAARLATPPTDPADIEHTMTGGVHHE